METIIIKSSTDHIFGVLSKLSNKKSAHIYENYVPRNQCFVEDGLVYQYIGEDPEVVGKIMKHHEFMTMVKEKENEWRIRTQNKDRKKHTSLFFIPKTTRKLMSRILEEEDFDSLALYFMEDELQSADIQVGVCGKEIAVSLGLAVVEKISVNALNALSLRDIPKYLKRVKRDIEDVRRMK